jgi:hypothetical protein
VATDDDLRHQVAIVRVEIRDARTRGLLIELLEVGRERGRDRPLGWATNALDACRVLEDWLQDLVGAARLSPPSDEETSE